MEPKSGSISRHDHARIHARMAKMETPAGFLKSDSSRVAFDGRALQFPAKVGLPPGVPPADLFDVATVNGSNGHAPGRGAKADAARARPLADPLASAAGYGESAASGRHGAPAGAGVFAGPGPVRARDRRSVEELPFVDEEDVIEEESLAEEADARHASEL